MVNPDRTELSYFQALWRRNLVVGAQDQGTAIHQQLIDAYHEPLRVYHTLKHIRQCLELFQKVSDQLAHADALELAIWFHDMIYQPGADDNERRSAEWFMQYTKSCFDDSLRTRVYDLIMCTLHCGNEIHDQDARFMVDIDLSSFGMPWEQFLEDSENVRRELPDMSDAEFYPKQRAFGQSLLDKPRFFQSDYFFEHFETRARRNLADYFELIERKIVASDSQNP